MRFLGTPLLEWAKKYIPDPLYLRWKFRRKLGYWPKLENPRTFNELLNTKKLTHRDPVLTMTADKVAVRDFVRERVGERYLSEVYSVAERFDDLDFSRLPQRYVLKASHGTSMNYFVDERHEPDRDEARRLFEGWLRHNHYHYAREWAYRDIPPRILVEEHLGDATGALPEDYKFHVFAGEVRLIEVHLGRFGDHRLALFDEKWKELVVTDTYPSSAGVVFPPRGVAEMKEVAARLGEGFDYVRVDLYDVEGRVRFGEMTHYPSAGYNLFDPVDFDMVLGEIWRWGSPIPRCFYREQRKPLSCGTLEFGK